MTESDALPSPATTRPTIPDVSCWPIWWPVSPPRVAAGAAGYEAAARQAEGALRHALEALARAKHAEAADLAPLARTLGVPRRRAQAAAS